MIGLVRLWTSRWPVSIGSLAATSAARVSAARYDAVTRQRSDRDDLDELSQERDHVRDDSGCSVGASGLDRRQDLSVGVPASYGQVARADAD